MRVQDTARHLIKFERIPNRSFADSDALGGFPD